jgi:two-component system C4-dicarboxylate transport sensor histidine kinase DctB
MNPLAKFMVERRLLAWGLAILVACLAGWLSSQQARGVRQQERLDNLRTETERRSIEIMSQTLNGSLMGAVAVLGLIDPAIKQEALGKLPANTSKVFPTLESIGRSYDAEGVFIVAENGVIASSWDNAGKPSTNLNVKFRPYYQMAMQGMDNVYAAVSLARGDRSLYFSVPVFNETTNGTQAIGAVVARTNLLKVDNLLRDKADMALLLSPQGVVFASSRKEWIGHLAGQPTPERLKAIRELKQFGNMFESKEPIVLPLGVADGVRDFEGRRIAVATAKVQWNDPFGDWTLVLIEDLQRTVSAREHNGIGFLVGMAILLFGTMILHMMRGHYQQVLASQQLEVFARSQEASADSKTRIAAATVRLQRASGMSELMQVFLEEAHKLFGALQGVVYLSENDSLRLAGSYACGDPPPEILDMGEGLLGQCAVERQSRCIDAAPEGFAMIRSGLGETRPGCVLLEPIVINDKLLGVAEIALLQPLSDAGQSAFEELVGLLAMNIEIVGRSVHTEEVLSATRAAQQANAEQLTFQQALVDTIPYPVFYKDADTRFLGFNRAYAECFAVRREDLVGKRVLDLDYLPEADRMAYQSEDEAIIASVGSISREVRIPFADGKPHDTLYFVSGFCRPDGSPGGLVGTFIDISEMKQAQNELERLADAERFNLLAQGREARVIELKQEVNALCSRLSELPRYASADKETQFASDLPELPLGTNLKLVRLNWHDEYNCGEAEIDREHRTLFAIANDLINATVAGKSSAAIGEIIDQLVKETTQHFAHEESILQARGYPRLEAHAAIHRQLIDKAVHLIGEFKAGKVEAGPFFQFLAYDVIARHMLGEDREFFPLFRSGTEQAVAPVRKKLPGLAELVDLDELQKLFSAFCESVGLPAAIIDLEGKVLAASPWQRACTDFHRVNPESCARCIESDTSLALKLQDGQDYAMYQCKNGMTDCASPIILEGQHLANVFIGQFHLGPPDIEFFRQQARRFGYPEDDYLKAIADAPVADEKRLPGIMNFLSGFARMVSTMSLARHRADEAQQRLQQQAEQLHRERIAALSLAEDAERARIALEAISKESQA